MDSVRHNRVIVPVADFDTASRFYSRICFARSETPFTRRYSVDDLGWSSLDAYQEISASKTF